MIEKRLVQREIQPVEIIRGVQKDYAFLNEMGPEEALIAGDPYQRRKKAYQTILTGIQTT